MKYFVLVILFTFGTFSALGDEGINSKRNTLQDSNMKASLSIKTSKERFKNNEPIIIHVSLINLSENPIIIYDFKEERLNATYLIDFSIDQIESSSSEEIRLLRPYVAAKTGHAHEIIKLNKGESFQTRVNLRHWRVILQSPPWYREISTGTFKIKAIWSASATSIYGSEVIRGIINGLSSEPIIVKIE